MEIHAASIGRFDKLIFIVYFSFYFIDCISLICN